MPQYEIMATYLITTERDVSPDVLERLELFRWGEIENALFKIELCPDIPLEVWKLEE